MTPMMELEFAKSLFWIQIHNLSFNLLSPEIALDIGETLREVVRMEDTSEMVGGNFLRVRVAIDILHPLCRGRKITYDGRSEGWVSFKYEWPPNICYWCGRVIHDDKDCSLWLTSKGSLKMEDQQFGHWIRAVQFNSSWKSVVEVKGFEVDTSRRSSQI